MRVISGLFSRKIVRDGAWVAAGQLLSTIAALASIRIMTELLAPDEFGRLTLVIGIAALVLGLAVNPRLQALIRYYPEVKQDVGTAILRKIGLRMIWPLVAIGAACLSTAWVVSAPWLGGRWYTGFLVAGLFVTDCVRSFELSLFNAARRQREASLIYVADAWLRPLMAVALIFAFGSHAEGALAGYFAGSVFAVLAMVLSMKREGDGVHGVQRAHFEELAPSLASSIRRYALPLAPLAIFGWLSGMGDRYVVAGLLSLEDAGLYAAAYSLASRPFLMMSGVVELTMRPILQNAIAEKNMLLIARVKRIWLLIMTAGAALGVLCFTFLSTWVGHLLLAPEYHSATALMPWIALGYALYNVATVYTRFCYSFDDTRAVTMITTLGALLGVGTMVPATYFAGLAGAGGSVSVSFGVQLLISLILAKRAERNYVVTAIKSVRHGSLRGREV